MRRREEGMEKGGEEEEGGWLGAARSLSRSKGVWIGVCMCAAEALT